MSIPDCLNLPGDDSFFESDPLDGSDEFAELDKTVLEHMPLTELYAETAEARGLAGPEEAAVFLLNRTAMVRVFSGKDRADSRHWEEVRWVPSGRMGGGPRKPHFGAEVVICGKMPGAEELRLGRPFVGPSGDLLRELSSGIEDNGVNLWQDVFASAFGVNVLRFSPVVQTATLKKEHVSDCLPLLAQELACLHPKYLVVLGADALKAILGRGMTLSKGRGRCFLLMEPWNFGSAIDAEKATDEQFEAGIKVFATIHPAAAVRESGFEPGLEADLREFLRLRLYGRKALACVSPSDVEYVTADGFASLLDVVVEVVEYFELNPEIPREMAIDCEWGGKTFLTGAIRTVQFCWRKGCACTVVFRREGLAEAQDEAERIRMIDLLKGLILGKGSEFSSFGGVRVFGHNIRADMLWLSRMGIDLSVIDDRYEGRICWDTMLADHVLCENAEHGLDACALRYTNMGRYDAALRKWLEDNKGSKLNLKEDAFSHVPSDILHFYGACDADATFRVKAAQEARFAAMRADEAVGGERTGFSSMLISRFAESRKAIDRPSLSSRRNPEDCLMKTVIPCTYPIFEIERNGILPDVGLLEDFVLVYDRKKKEMEKRLKELVGDPEFNVRSVPQTARLLYSCRRERVGENGSLSGWIGLGYEPLKTTGKPSRLWEDVKEAVVGIYRPSTDGESLEWLAAQHLGETGSEIVELINDFRGIDQIAKMYLTAPREDGRHLSGLLGAIDVDGRIHTRISQMSETGRWRSSNPNCQNIPKRAVAELEAVLGESLAYAAKIRSGFIAPPGKVFVEADYKSAEIYTLGYLANCPDLVRDAAADLHARGAVNYFGADKWDGFGERRVPSKEWLTENKNFRLAAKTINFGIPYQRGSAAVAREIVKSTKGKVHCDRDGAQKFIDGFYSTYPEVGVYVEACKTSIRFPTWLDNPFGRRRRFRNSADRSLLAGQEREAVNFPIQSTVAEMLNSAAHSLWLACAAYPEVKFKIVLGVHDAFIFEVSGEDVPFFVDRILPYCMTLSVKVPPWLPEIYRLGVDGFPMYDLPFYASSTKSFGLDIDVEISVRWGEKATASDLAGSGVSERWLEEKGW